MINEEKYMFGLKKYQNGMGAVRAAEEAHISYIEFRKFLKEKKVWRDSISYNNLYPQFKNIDSEEKAYWLGFLYADGSVSSQNNNIELALAEKDYEHLVKFSSFMGIKKDKIKKRVNKKNFISYRVIITNKDLKQDLIDKGCTPRKSLTLLFPSEEKVPKHLLKHFVRGYIDGDGSIGRYRENKDRVQLQILGTPEFLNSLVCNMGWKKLSFGHNKHHLDRTYFAIWEAKYVQDYLNEIYLDANIYLTRKHKIALPFFIEK